MSKKTRKIKYYPNGSIYEGWIERGKRVYFGKLFINHVRNRAYYGIWSKDILIRGYFSIDMENTKIYLENQNVFNDFRLDSCSICLEDMISRNCVLLTCRHIFCLDCIHIWLVNKNKCPLCRHAINFSFRNRILNKNELLTFNFFSQ